MKFLLSILLIFVFNSIVNGQQIGMELIDVEKVSPWIPSSTQEYQGAYHFGDSESESSLIILYNGTETVAQIVSGQFSDDGKLWIKKRKNLSKVRIKGNQFYSDQTNGRFVVYTGDVHPVKGLRVEQPWSGIIEKGRYEIGYRTSGVEAVFSGDFPEASIRVLEAAEVKEMKLRDLKLMRNEIFARYGYIFRKNGAMETHFREKEWYQPQHENVTSYLTSIERKNIELIQKTEKNK